jgi:hypothetical protein
MTRLLLDFPWEVASVANPDSDAYTAFYQFERLCETEHLKPVPFVAPADYEALRDNPTYTRGSNLRATLQVLNRYIRESSESIPAVPESGPTDLSDRWKSALNDELHLNDWRSPQIIICEHRSDAWRPSMAGTSERAEVRLRCENSGERHRRVVALLESYDRHLFARSDRDPWDLQRWKPVRAGTPMRQRHPCRLPKPAILNSTELENLRPTVARIKSWEIEGRYHFLPKDEWDPLNVNQSPWREGRTFPRGDCPHCDRRLPIDRNKHVWCWDEQERHWDVQFRDGEEYYVISHDGRLIRKRRRSRKRKKGRRKK